MSMSNNAVPNARPRKEGETYEEYRELLKLEQIRRKQKLSGRIVWISSMIIDDGFTELEDGTEIPKHKKVKVRGTYRKGA